MATGRQSVGETIVCASESLAYRRLDEHWVGVWLLLYPHVLCTWVLYIHTPCRWLLSEQSNNNDAPRPTQLCASHCAPLPFRDTFAMSTEAVWLAIDVSMSILHYGAQFQITPISACVYWPNHLLISRYRRTDREYDVIDIVIIEIYVHIIAFYECKFRLILLPGTIAADHFWLMEFWLQARKLLCNANGRCDSRPSCTRPLHPVRMIELLACNNHTPQPILTDGCNIAISSSASRLTLIYARVHWEKRAKKWK